MSVQRRCGGLRSHSLELPQNCPSFLSWCSALNPLSALLSMASLRSTVRSPPPTAILRGSRAHTGTAPTWRSSRISRCAAAVLKRFDAVVCPAAGMYIVAHSLSVPGGCVPSCCEFADAQDIAAAFAAYRKTHRKVYHSAKQVAAGKAAFVANLHYMVQQNSKLSNPCAPPPMLLADNLPGPCTRSPFDPSHVSFVPGPRPAMGATRIIEEAARLRPADGTRRPAAQVPARAEQIQRYHVRAVPGAALASIP